MGTITPDKKFYDELAVDFFSREGWKAFAVAKTGRYADVIGVQGNNLAIVEVKSPNETSAVKSYDDSANLSSYLDSKIGDYLRETRREVFDLFGRGQAIEQLYAVTVTSQIYRYIHEFEEKADEYESAVSGAVRLSNKRFDKSPFLVIPSEYAEMAKRAVSVLARNRYISSPKSKDTGRIYVISFEYKV